MIRIEGLAKGAYLRLYETFGQRIFKEEGILNEGVYTCVFLNDNAIIKYNGDVWVDLVGVVDVIYETEFFAITLQ